MGGGKTYHQGVNPLEVPIKHLEVGEAISKEVHDILMLSFKDLQGVNEDGFDAQIWGIVGGMAGWVQGWVIVFPPQEFTGY